MPVNNIPNFSDMLKFDPQVLYNVILDLQNKLDELETSIATLDARIKVLENK